MATFHIQNFGCRATAADAAAIECQFAQSGYAHAQADAADVVVLNTCTVTASADAQARQAIRAVHDANPAARIVVTGCYAQRAPEELAAIGGVALVVGNSHVSQIVQHVNSVVHPQPGSGALVQIADPMSLDRGPAKILTGDIFELSTVNVAPIKGGESNHTRPVVKIQDGCNNRCAYCVIPFVRGRSRSLPPAEIVREIARLSARGFREIVLSGINLGSYGRDLTPRADLVDVLWRILEETPIERLRLSSVEPMDVTQELVDLVAASPRFARHFHIPLQSGSDRILKAMHRWYRAAHYAQRIALIRERIPGAGIGADVIAGFPGESDQDHHATMDLIERLPFTYLHVFSFSKRPGTRAQSLANEVPGHIVRQRARELRALAAQKAAAFRASQAGATLRALTLRDQGSGATGDWTAAVSDNYLKLRLPGHRPANLWAEVTL